MSRPAIFLERDGILTNPLPAPVPTWLEQALAFWVAFPTEQSMNHFQEWGPFWENAPDLKAKTDKQIADTEERMRQFGTKDVRRVWRDASIRQRRRGAILHLLGTAIPGGVFCPHIWEPLAAMEEAGYFVCIASNQGDLIEAGAELTAVINYHRYVTAWFRAMGLELGREAHSYLCIHKAREQCDCRKPRLGLFTMAQEDHEIDFARSWLIDSKDTHVGTVYSLNVRSIVLSRGNLWQAWRHIEENGR